MFQDGTLVADATRLAETGLQAKEPTLAYALEPGPGGRSGEYSTSLFRPALAARVLVAERSDRIFRGLATCGAMAGIELITARDGREALSRAWMDLPDLIICELDMPLLSGLEVCKALRESNWLGRVPFLLVATRVTRELAAQAGRCGADLCLDQSADPVEVAGLVHALLR